MMAGCKPSTVAEAEAKGDVAWLDNDGSPSAVEALGRLADHDPAAVAVLDRRAKFAVSAYIAAWGGVKRGAKWGSDILHSGLQDPARAELAASAIDGRDAVVVPFLPDVEASLTRLAAGGMVTTLAAVLAAGGPAAHDAVNRRLADKATRGVMCGGLAVSTASEDAKALLRSVPPESRDNLSCVSAVVAMAATDDAAMKWLAEQAEPGMLSAASRLQTIDCSRLQLVWTDALATRSPAQAATLTVPVSLGMKRCPAVMDGVLADSIRKRPAAYAAVVGAIDPFSPDDAAMHATCAALPAVARAKTTGFLKERAADALAHGCKGLP